jgi:hypothetical protein
MTAHNLAPDWDAIRRDLVADTLTDRDLARKLAALLRHHGHDSRVVPSGPRGARHYLVATRHPTLSGYVAYFHEADRPDSYRPRRWVVR